MTLWLADYWLDDYWPEASSPAGVPDELLTLSVADNGDGTGAVATIGSSTGGSVYVRTASTLGASWLTHGPRVGDGDLPLSLPVGAYWAQAFEVSGNAYVASSPMVYFGVTGGDTDSVHYRCLESTRDRIELLDLDSIASDSLVLRKLPLDRGLGVDGIELPCVIVSPVRETILGGGTVGMDDVGYGVLVTYVSADNSNLPGEMDKITLWRERMSRAFRAQRLNGVPEVWDCRPEPGDVYVPEAWRQNLAVGAVMLRFIAREPRG